MSPECRPTSRRVVSNALLARIGEAIARVRAESTPKSNAHALDAMGSSVAIEKLLNSKVVPAIDKSLAAWVERNSVLNRHRCEVFRGVTVDGLFRRIYEYRPRVPKPNPGLSPLDPDRRPRDGLLHFVTVNDRDLLGRGAALRYVERVGLKFREVHAASFTDTTSFFTLLTEMKSMEVLFIHKLECLPAHLVPSLIGAMRDGRIMKPGTQPKSIFEFEWVDFCTVVASLDHESHLDPRLASQFKFILKMEH